MWQIRSGAVCSPASKLPSSAFASRNLINACSWRGCCEISCRTKSSAWAAARWAIEQQWHQTASSHRLPACVCIIMTSHNTPQFGAISRCRVYSLTSAESWNLYVVCVRVQRVRRQTRRQPAVPSGSAPDHPSESSLRSWRTQILKTRRLIVKAGCGLKLHWTDRDAALFANLDPAVGFFALGGKR